MDEKPMIRVMPNSLEAEQSVIGAVLVDPASILEIMDIISGDDFYHKIYGHIFDIMTDMSNRGQKIDFVTLQDEIKKDEAIAETFSMNDFKNLIINVPTAANIRQYALIVRDKSILRNIIKVNEDIAGKCYGDSAPINEILNETEERIFKLVQSGGAKETVSIKELIYEVIERTQKASKYPGEVQGVPTGFIDLDRYLSGLHESDLVLIAARPSMGKTAFVLNIAEYAALKKGVTTAVFSLEMSAVQLTARLLSMESGVEAEKIRNGSLSGADWQQLVYGSDELGKSHLIIDDTPAISIPELRSRCRKYKLEKNLGLVIIDYLQLMSGTGRSQESRQQEISEISRGLKALARELDVPVVALSQLSRAPEQRQDHRPMLSDLRESGAIEQDADVVMFIYRDDYYNKDSEMKGVAEIIIAKQRNGPVGTVKLAWIPSQTKFANLEHFYDENDI